MAGDGEGGGVGVPCSPRLDMPLLCPDSSSDRSVK